MEKVFVDTNIVLEFQMDVTITRNKKDFKNSSLPVFTVNEYLNR